MGSHSGSGLSCMFQGRGTTGHRWVEFTTNWEVKSGQYLWGWAWVGRQSVWQWQYRITTRPCCSQSPTPGQVWGWLGLNKCNKHKAGGCCQERLGWGIERGWEGGLGGVVVGCLGRAGRRAWALRHQRLGITPQGLLGTQTVCLGIKGGRE